MRLHFAKTLALLVLLSIGADQAAVRLWQSYLAFDRLLPTRWLVAVSEAARRKQRWTDRMTTALKERWAIKRDPAVALALYHHLAAHRDAVGSRSILEEAMQLRLRPWLRVQVVGAYVARGLVERRIEHVRRTAYELCELANSTHHELYASVAWCAVTIDEFKRKDLRWRSSLQKFLRTADARAYWAFIEESGVPLNNTSHRLRSV